MAVRSATQPAGDPGPDGVGTSRRTRAARVALRVNLVAQIGIVVTGGLVRLTGSGLGCPTWPQCVPGSYTPVLEQAEGYHKYIEFGNRLLTGVVGLTALIALITVWRLGRRRLRPVAVLPLVGVAAQAVIGGVTVLTSLHPITVATHFLVSMLLVAVSTYLLLRIEEPDGPARPAVPRPLLLLGWALAVVGAVVLALGTVVTGSGPHSGDADEPARFGFDPRTISWLHADTVLLFVGLLVGLLVGLVLVGASTTARQRATALATVTALQGLVGYLQYATGLPEVLVLAHMLGASLLTVALTAVVMALYDRTGAAPVGPDRGGSEAAGPGRTDDRVPSAPST